ncbi:MAG: UvrD-helicase domain-containing protein [Actinomycetota bacterium]
MAETHPELQAEQAHVDLAYQRLDEARDEAVRLKTMVEVGKGGTNQARWEREIFYENIANRLRQLDLGERSLCFGRIDQSEDAGGGSYHIGRIAVAGETQEPLIVDWRAPVAESFYRATGRDPQGLVRRRHFTSRGRRVLDLEDEFFGDAAGSGRVMVNGRELRGTGALINALEENRTGRLGDIIGTIQAEQDEIIRSAMAGVLVVQGGPGTGKTVVALHRAAYLLYAHRFPLEGQGVLVVGPNRLFLGYIEQVLPSLGEAGVELAVLADLVPDVRVTGRDHDLAARIKGDLRMVNLVRRAVRARQRPLRTDLTVGMGVRRIRVPRAETVRIVEEARRRYRTHNAARKFVVQSLFEALAAHHPDGLDPEVAREQLTDHPDVRAALMWMWPILTPAQLLHDLYGSAALLRSAGGAKLTDDELAALNRPWQEGKDASAVVWTVDDVPVLDEAMERLGPKPRTKRPGAPSNDARTYGHIVVDEAQDLSPLQLRMLTRRSLNGSMTIVGDIAQSTGAWAHGDWQEVLDHLPERREPRRTELTVGYRIPAPVMDLAAKVLALAAPDLKPPVAVRSEGDPPEMVVADSIEQLHETVVRQAVAESERPGVGNVAVVVPRGRYRELVEAFESAGVTIGSAPRDGLDHPITAVPVNLVKGLEVDVAVVVEPADIVDEEPQGYRSLYVAMTRATKRLALVHARPLPDVLG